MTSARPGSAGSGQRLRIAVAGASGRMGRTLIEAIGASADCVLTGALDVAGSPLLGQPATASGSGPTQVPITADLHAGLASADVLIDFTRPAGTLAHAAVCRELGIRSLVAVPIRAESGVVGVFEIFGSAPGAFGTREVTFLEEMSEVAAMLGGYELPAYERVLQVCAGVVGVALLLLPLWAAIFRRWRERR